MFLLRNKKIIFELSLVPPLIWSSLNYGGKTVKEYYNIILLYCLTVQAGFYSNRVDCLTVFRGSQFSPQLGYLRFFKSS